MHFSNRVGRLALCFAAAVFAPAAARATGSGPGLTPPLCVGDCNHDSQVTVDEILTMVNIALGNALVTACAAGDANHDGQITVDEVLTAVNVSQRSGCPS
jgi:hypothetical protein